MKQLSLLIIVSLFLPMAASAAFNEVSLITGTTLRLTVGGTTLDLTVTNGTVERVDVYNATLGITLAGGSSVDLASADRYTFSYTKSNATAEFTCGSSSSSLGLALAGGQTTETVSVNPSATVCQAATSGGGGPATTTTTTTTTTSSTPSTTSTTASTPSTTTTTAAATPSTTTTTASTPPAAAPAPSPAPASAPPAPVPAPTPAPVVSAAPVLMSQLNPGARSDEVMTLQELLAQDPEIYPEGIISGYYGPLTTAAVRKFQSKYGIATVGRVGPQTLAKINEVFGEGEPAVAARPSAPSVQAQTANQIQSQIQAIQQQIQALTSGVTIAPVTPVPITGAFSSNLALGSRSEDVRRLQQLLNSDPDTMVAASGVASPSRETTYFGPATRAAVQKFQVKYGIAGPGDAGYGRVGPATRAKLQEVFGDIYTPLIPSPPVTSESPSSAAPKAPVTASAVDVMTKQIEDQIKVIQAQIDALLKR